MRGWVQCRDRNLYNFCFKSLAGPINDPSIIKTWDDKSYQVTNYLGHNKIKIKKLKKKFSTYICICVCLDSSNAIDSKWRFEVIEKRLMVARHLIFSIKHLWISMEMDQ